MVELMDLPSKNLMEILSKLPLKTILVCKCVCKTFLDLTSTSDPYFTALLSAHPASKPATQDLIIQFRDPIIEVERVRKHPKHIKSYVQFIDAAKLGPDPTTAQLRASPLYNIPEFLMEEHRWNKRPRRNKFALVNACNGLIYFAVQSSNWCSLVCNPITKEYITVPQVEKNLHERTVSLWLGYSSSTRKYKVLRIYWNYDKELFLAHIHDVGSGNSWREVEINPSNPLCKIVWDDSYALLNNGTIGYWLCSTIMIVSFDFESEVFRIGEIDFPPGLDVHSRIRDDLKFDVHRMSIGVMKDRLCLTDTVLHFDLWMLGSDSVWEKKYTCEESIFPRDLWVVVIRPMQELSTGEILMVAHNEWLVCYDPDKNSFRFIDHLHMMKPKFNAVTIVPSFEAIVKGHDHHDPVEEEADRDKRVEKETRLPRIFNVLQVLEEEMQNLGVEEEIEVVIDEKEMQNLEVEEEIIEVEEDMQKQEVEPEVLEDQEKQVVIEKEMKQKLQVEEEVKLIKKSKSQKWKERKKLRKRSA